MSVHVSTSAHWEILMSTRSAVSDRYMYLLTDRLLLFGIYCRLEFLQRLSCALQEPGCCDTPSLQSPALFPEPRPQRNMHETTDPSFSGNDEWWMMNARGASAAFVDTVCYVINWAPSHCSFMSIMFPVPEQLIYGSALIVMVVAYIHSQKTVPFLTDLFLLFFYFSIFVVSFWKFSFKKVPASGPNTNRTVTNKKEQLNCTTGWWIVHFKGICYSSQILRIFLTQQFNTFHKHS